MVSTIQELLDLWKPDRQPSYCLFGRVHANAERVSSKFRVASKVPTIEVLCKVVLSVKLLMTFISKTSPFIQRSTRAKRRWNKKPTLVPLIRPPSTIPLASAATREKPSGATSKLEITRSPLGPIFACVAQITWRIVKQKTMRLI